MNQIIRNSSGARLVESIAMLISRCSIQVLACLFLSSIQNCSIVFPRGKYSMRSSASLLRRLARLNTLGFCSIPFYSFSTADSPIDRPSSRKARRYSAGSSS